MPKLPASLEGVLEQIQLVFLDLEKQEKRALHSIKTREQEIHTKLTEEAESVRSLKEIDVIDNLNIQSLKIINDNNKIKVDLIKFYANSIVNQKDGSIAVVENLNRPDMPFDSAYLDKLRNSRRDSPNDSTANFKP